MGSGRGGVEADEVGGWRMRLEGGGGEREFKDLRRSVFH